MGNRPLNIARKGPQGFTLLEIITVLSIVGILAAVAVTKYTDLRKDAQTLALKGAFAAISSQATMDYSKALLSDPSVANNWSAAADATTMMYGDFRGNYACVTDGSCVATVLAEGSPAWVATLETGLTQAFTLYVDEK